MKFPFSQAEKLALLCLGVSVALLFFFRQFAFIPLVFFLCCCCVAPFLPRWGFFLPVISRGNAKSKGVALTFDDGPTPETTPLILKLLARHKYRATFFVVGEKAAKYPDLICDILDDGHNIANHSWKHDKLLMLRRRKALRHDIQKTQQQLATFGIRPLLFRPPVGITNPLLKTVLEQEGMKTVTFSCRAFDGGNRRIQNLSQRIMKKIRHGDIVLLHDLPPVGAAVSQLQRELDTLFAALEKAGYGVVPLEGLIETPVCIKTGATQTSGKGNSGSFSS